MLMICLNMLETDEQRTSFEQFYREHRQDMFAFAMSILHNVQDAEDALSQAFFSIAQNFEKILLLPCHETRAYAVIVVKNKALNIYAANKREGERTVHLTEEQLGDEGYQRQVFSELDEAVAALDERYKDVVVLYYYYGFTAAETAQLLGIHADTVRHRAMRAKKLLKEALEKGEADDGQGV
ncbi:MAG: RNA polymerase sigma factor [Ruminococcus sp.]|nr:RNA polymerase sigma factor [Ruminococcus sp.]